MALPFPLAESMGVFLLRRTMNAPPFEASDVDFASTVVRSATTAIQRANSAETARADNHRLEELAHTDSLTHLVNRRGLTARFLAEMERVRRYNAPLSVLLLDLDHFKRVNDTHGHVAGDQVLAAVAALLKRAARTVDTVARYGGEEFVILLPETAEQGAVAFAERLRDKIEAQGFRAGAQQDVRVTVSVGVATYPSPHLDSVGDLLRAADAALYRAKGSGRNLVCV